MRLTITIESNNAAFNDGAGGRAQTVDILHTLTNRIANGANIFKAYDVNGNEVGAVTFAPNEDEVK